MVHKYPQNQSYVGSIGKTLTTNVSMTLCNWRIRPQTHVLSGRTAFGTDFSQVPNQYGPYAYCSLDKGAPKTKGGGGTYTEVSLGRGRAHKRSMLTG